MRKDSIKDRLITIAKIWGGIAAFILLIWFIVEVVSWWILAILCFLSFFPEVFKKQ